jgi:predicted transcriptional regulator
MSRTERLHIRISPELKKKVELIAKERNVSVSELLVDYIKRLPNPKVLLAISAVATIAALSLPTLSEAGWGHSRLGCS